MNLPTSLNFAAAIAGRFDYLYTLNGDCPRQLEREVWHGRGVPDRPRNVHHMCVCVAFARTTLTLFSPGPALSTPRPNRPFNPYGRPLRRPIRRPTGRHHQRRW